MTARAPGSEVETIEFKYVGDRVTSWRYEGSRATTNTITYEGGHIVEERRSSDSLTEVWRVKYARDRPVAITREYVDVKPPGPSSLGSGVDQVVEKYRVHDGPPELVWAADYDERGRLVTEKFISGGTARYRYDDRDREVARDYADDRRSSRTVTTYGPSDRCRPLPMFVASTSEVESHVQAPERCPVIEHITYSDGEPAEEHRSTYSADGDLLRRESHSDGEDPTGTAYTYDAAGNVLTEGWVRRDGVEPYATFEYDCWTRRPPD